jgi:hypothetical protein
VPRPPIWDAPRAAAHENSANRIFPRLGETASTSEVLAMLETTR